MECPVCKCPDMSQPNKETNYLYHDCPKCALAVIFEETISAKTILEMAKTPSYRPVLRQLFTACAFPIWNDEITLDLELDKVITNTHILESINKINSTVIEMQMILKKNTSWFFWW